MAFMNMQTPCCSEKLESIEYAEICIFENKSNRTILDLNWKD